MNYCPKCGGKLEENSIICQSCGIELEPGDSPVSLNQSPLHSYNARQAQHERFQAPRYAPPPPIYRPQVNNNGLTNIYGIVGVIFGLISFIPIFIGVIFGILAMILGGMGRERDDSPVASIAAIILGFFGFFIGIFLSLLFIPFSYYYPYY